MIDVAGSGGSPFADGNHSDFSFMMSALRIVPGT